MMRSKAILAVAALAVVTSVAVAIGCRGGNGIFGRIAERRQSRIQDRQAARAVWAPTTASAAWSIQEVAEAAPPTRPEVVAPASKPELVKPATSEDAKAIGDKIDKIRARFIGHDCSDQCVCGCVNGQPCPCVALRRQHGAQIEHRPDTTRPPVSLAPISAPMYYTLPNGAVCGPEGCVMPRRR